MSDEDREKALNYHRLPTPGKLRIEATTAMTSQRDLALAYSPGVAYPCLDIAETPENAYRYTSKGNLVAVISNGTAVLGLGAVVKRPVVLPDSDAIAVRSMS